MEVKRATHNVEHCLGFKEPIFPVCYQEIPKNGIEGEYTEKPRPQVMPVSPFFAYRLKEKHGPSRVCQGVGEYSHGVLPFMYR